MNKRVEEIKHAVQPGREHSRYQHFTGYGEGEEFRDRLPVLRKDFDDLLKKDATPDNDPAG